MNAPQRIFYGSIETGIIWDSLQQAEAYLFQFDYKFPVIEFVEHTPLMKAAPEMYAILKACVTQHSADIEERGNATRRLDFISRMAKYATDLADGKPTRSPI